MPRTELIFCLALVLVCSARAAEPTSASSPDTLAEGKIIYLAPADWNSLGKRADGLSAGYAMPEGKAQIVIVCAPQQQTIPDELGPKLAMTIGKAIRGEAAKGNIEQVTPPKSEEDKRFLLKIHDQYKVHGKFSDRVQLFRGVGKNLVSVTVNAFTENPDEAKAIHEAAEQMMVSVRLNRPGSAPPTSAPARAKPGAAATSQPVVFNEPKLRVAPPVGWRSEPTGHASGVIVTWRDPTDSSNLITLSFRPIPEQAKADPALRGIAIDQLAAGEKPSFQVEGGEPIGQTQTIHDKRFLRKIRTDYQAHDVKFRVTMRVVRAGLGIASLTSVALQDKADEVDALADKVAAEVKGVGD